MTTAGHEGPEYIHVTLDEIPEETRPFFRLAPNLALHDGPWTYHRHPRLGSALKIASLVVGGCFAVALVMDQLREDTLMKGQLVIAGIAFGLVAMVLVSAPGFILSDGRIRHRPTGRHFGEKSEDYVGSMALGTAVHAALMGEGITHRKILTMFRREPEDGRLIVQVHWHSRDDVAFAGVYLKRDNGEYVVWPPVSIPADWVAELSHNEPNTFDAVSMTR